MKLKNCNTINIDGASVERIKMFGEVVWEKIKETMTVLTILPAYQKENKYVVTFGNTFILRAYTTQFDGTIIGGIILFKQHKLDDNDRIIETTELGTRTIENGVAEISLSAAIGYYKYTAEFQETKKYKKSIGEISKVEIQKETPIIQFFGEQTIYKGWRVGVKVTKSDGVTPIKNETVKFWCNGIPYNKQTNNNGVGVLNIQLDNPGDYEITAEIKNNPKYVDTEVKRTYIYKKYKTETLNPNNWRNDISGQPTAPYQIWETNDIRNFKCRQKTSYCNTTATIATYSGTYKQPMPLVIAFSIPSSASTIAEAKLKYDSNQEPACPGSHGGALFNSPPAVTISYDDISYNAPCGTYKKEPINFPQWNYYNGYYASNGPINQEIIWDYSSNVHTISTGQITIKLSYPFNSGVEEGYLTVSNVKLIISYSPTQQTSFE